MFISSWSRSPTHRMHDQNGASGKILLLEFLTSRKTWLTRQRGMKAYASMKFLRNDEATVWYALGWICLEQKTCSLALCVVTKSFISGFPRMLNIMSHVHWDRVQLLGFKCPLDRASAITFSFPAIWDSRRSCSFFGEHYHFQNQLANIFGVRNPLSVDIFPGGLSVKTVVIVFSTCGLTASRVCLTDNISKVFTCAIVFPSSSSTNGLPILSDMRLSQWMTSTALIWKELPGFNTLLWPTTTNAVYFPLTEKFVPLLSDLFGLQQVKF